MATTRKARPKKKVASSEPVAARTKVDEPEVTVETVEKDPIAPPAPRVEPKADPPKAPEPEPRKRIFAIHLLQGSRYSSKGVNFVAGRPLVTTDVKVYERFRFNGRLRIDVREGGAE